MRHISMNISVAIQEGYGITKTNVSNLPVFKPCQMCLCIVCLLIEHNIELHKLCLIARLFRKKSRFIYVFIYLFIYSFIHSLVEQSS
jgi:hypothetical protein